LRCDTVVANERNIVGVKNVNKSCNEQILILKGAKRMLAFYLSILVVLVTGILILKGVKRMFAFYLSILVILVTRILILKGAKRMFAFYLSILVILVTRILLVFKISLILMNLKTAFYKMLSEVA
jgi:hypothetical protein